jgi:TRAP-type uncharacterized transport system substrate-binding protein
MKLMIAATVLSVVSASLAVAQQRPANQAGPAVAQQRQPDQIARANEGTVGVITGMEGGTYARTGADLTILDDGTLRVLPMLGKGSLQNLSDILYLKGVDVGFVQSDALAYAKQHGMLPNLTQSIRYIAKLYDEEVHVLARKDIRRLEDLNGQRVNVDVTGSGSAMTAEILLDALGIKAKVEHEKQVNGLQELKHGISPRSSMSEAHRFRSLPTCRPTAASIFSRSSSIRLSRRLICRISSRTTPIPCSSQPTRRCRRSPSAT